MGCCAGAECGCCQNFGSCSSNCREGVRADDTAMPDGGEFGFAATSSDVCIYTNPSSVDMNPAEEGPNMIADINTFLGRSATEFTSMSDMETACTTGGTMVMPELQDAPMSAADSEKVKAYIEAGGSVIFSDDA